MNVMKLKEVNERNIVYFYQPEGEGDFGEILYEISLCEARIVKRAEKDEGGFSYGEKAVRKVGEFVAKNNLPINYTQAWY